MYNYIVLNKYNTRFRKQKTARRGYTPFSSRLCERKHDGKGEFPFSSRLCGKKHDGVGETPPRRVCVERNTTEKGFPPYRRVSSLLSPRWLWLLHLQLLSPSLSSLAVTAADAAVVLVVSIRVGC